MHSPSSEGSERKGEKVTIAIHNMQNYQTAGQNGPAIRQQSYRHLSTKSTLPCSESEVSLWRRGSFEFVKKERMERRTAASLRIAYSYYSSTQIRPYPRSSCLMKNMSRRG